MMSVWANVVGTGAPGRPHGLRPRNRTPSGTALRIVIRRPVGARGRSATPCGECIGHVSLWGVLNDEGHLRLQVGSAIVHFGKRVSPKEFRQIQAQQQEYPLRLPKIDERRYWQFQDSVYWESEDLDADEVYALLVSQQQVEEGRKRGRIERAKAMVAMGM
jgi:hypothetical protein